MVWTFTVVCLTKVNHHTFLIWELMTMHATACKLGCRLIGMLAPNGAPRRFELCRV